MVQYWDTFLESACGIGRRVPGHGCYLYHSDWLTWPAANVSCVQLGGHLVSFETPEEIAAVDGTIDFDFEGAFTLAK